MKVERLISVINQYLLDEGYLGLVEKNSKAAKRATDASGYNGADVVDKDILPSAIVYFNTFWANLPDSVETMTSPGYMTLCHFNDVWLPELEDYDEIYGTE